MWHNKVSALCLQAHTELLNHQFLDDSGTTHLDVCTEETMDSPEKRWLTELPGTFATKYLPNAHRSTPDGNFQLSLLFLLYLDQLIGTIYMLIYVTEHPGWRIWPSQRPPKEFLLQD